VSVRNPNDHWIPGRAAALLLIAGCGGNRQCASPRSDNHAQSTAVPSTTTSRSGEVSDQQDWFVDGTQEAGLDARRVLPKQAWGWMLAISITMAMKTCS
jgi:hypothetical protein